jgi:hypothetical protein
MAAQELHQAYLALLLHTLVAEAEALMVAVEELAALAVVAMEVFRQLHPQPAEQQTLAEVVAERALLAQRRYLEMVALGL